MFHQTLTILIRPIQRISQVGNFLHCIDDCLVIEAEKVSAITRGVIRLSPENTSSSEDQAAAAAHRNLLGSKVTGGMKRL